jgi:NAD(P)-dependent dehydrogenase (short-subunit alcohol dehydrogenase family)
LTAHDLTGRVSIISGIGPGLGRELALSFARAGSEVVIGARTQANLDELEVELAKEGFACLSVRTDITDAAACQHLVDATLERHGKLDVLVNNAFALGPWKAMLDSDLDEWRDALEVNVIGTMRLSLAAVRAMEPRGGGAIVMINSQAMRRSAPLRGSYAASKAALLSATQTLANEVGRLGIRVNSVVPGHIWGPALEGYFAERAAKKGVDPEAFYDEVAKDLALRRIPTGAEVAAAAVFLASDAASAITGQALDVNGGNWFH